MKKGERESTKLATKIGWEYSWDGIAFQERRQLAGILKATKLVAFRKSCALLAPSDDWGSRLI
jgi:hypothetical protein